MRFLPLLLAGMLAVPTIAAQAATSPTKAPTEQTNSPANDDFTPKAGKTAQNTQSGQTTHANQNANPATKKQQAADTAGARNIKLQIQRIDSIINELGHDQAVGAAAGARQEARQYLNQAKDRLEQALREEHQG